jgi:signal transduction histidine kinase
VSDLLQALPRYSRTGTSELSHSLVSLLAEIAKDAAGNPEHQINRADKYRKESEPPVMKISGSVSGSVCRISISDNGIGFEGCYSKQIFKPFTQLHARNSPYRGTGKGVAICRKIVARHGGDSTPGQGATFIVTLPKEQKIKA